VNGWGEEGIWSQVTYPIMAEKCFEAKAKFRMTLYPATRKGDGIKRSKKELREYTLNSITSPAGAGGNRSVRIDLLLESEVRP
jgi:hypothetical protein